MFYFNCLKNAISNQLEILRNEIWFSFFLYFVCMCEGYIKTAFTKYAWSKIKGYETIV